MQAHISFGSDWQVASMNLMTGVYGALNRTPWQEGDSNQSQALEDTLLCCTRHAAYAEIWNTKKES